MNTDEQRYPEAWSSWLLRHGLVQWLLGLTTISIFALLLWSEYQPVKEAEERNEAMKKEFEKWQPLLQQPNAPPQAQPVQNK